VDRHLKRLQREIESVLSDPSSVSLTWHPQGKWSAAEILEHLYLTYTGTIKGFERVMQSGELRTTPPTWKQRAGKLLVLGLGHLPAGREAPSMSRPRGLPPEQVRTEIVSKIADMDDAIARCDRQFGAGKELLDHPVLGPLNASQWRKFHLVHGLHHLRQIRRLQQLRAGTPH
jgi:hypothetical protein